MDKLEVTIIPEDFKNSPRGYHHSEDGKVGCVLWQALRRSYPKSTIDVGAKSVFIDNKGFDIDTTIWGTFLGWAVYTPRDINEMSKRAKESLDGIPTIKLTLKPMITYG